MRKLSYLLVFVGLLLMLYPTINHWIEDMEQQKLIHMLEDVEQPAKSASAEAIGDELNQLFAAEPQEAYPASVVTEQPVPELKPDPELNQPDKTAKNPLPAVPVASAQAASPKKAAPAPLTRAIGLLRIEAIDLKLPIVEGIRSQDLKVSPGHIPGTALPGQIGNSVIAGHRSYSYGRMFNRLEQLEIGQAIALESKGQTYSYIIYDKKMVDPTDVSVLNHNNKDKILTLITCDEEGNQRLILHAKIMQKA